VIDVSNSGPPIPNGVGAAVPIAGNKSKLRRVKKRRIKGFEKTCTNGAVSRGVDVGNRKGVTTNSNVPAKHALGMVKRVGVKCVARSEKKTDMVRPDGWPAPCLSPKCRVLRGSVCFL
jgi:hypothetical protein